MAVYFIGIFMYLEEFVEKEQEFCSSPALFQ